MEPIKHFKVLFVSAFVLAGCNSSAPRTDQTRALSKSTAPAAASPGSATSGAPAVTPSAEVIAGKQVFDRTCSVCHNAGNETVPGVGVLRSLPADRISFALSDNGLMKAQAKMLTGDQRNNVISYLTAPRPVFAALAGDPRKEDMRPEYKYPVRMSRPDRDANDAPIPRAWSSPPLADGPFKFETWEQPSLRVSIVTRGLDQPRHIEFLPDGSILIPEKAGALRIIRNGKLDPKPVAGLPAVAANLGVSTGLMDVTLHPDFRTNGLVYISYSKPHPKYPDLGFSAVYRGHWDGEKIVDGKDIFVSRDVGTYYSRLKFGGDGKLYVTIGGPGVGSDGSMMRAQHPDDYAGKTLRLNDDGTVPTDNPFVGRKGYDPEIFTMGHRIAIGLTLNPWTNELWESENGPYGGDEVNILRKGQNYGWPIISDGRFYGGNKVSPDPFKEGITRPHLSYVPPIAPSGMVFYSGDKFPNWKRNLFLGSMRMGETPRSGHIERVVFNDKFEAVRNEILILDLHQRIRDIAQGPDGYLYAITDEAANSVLLRLEPGDK
jgi:glucose/arabinose dehydrogenase/mono/diheme cytochrome c family protein